MVTHGLIGRAISCCPGRAAAPKPLARLAETVEDRERRGGRIVLTAATLDETPMTPLPGGDA